MRQKNIFIDRVIKIPVEHFSPKELKDILSKGTSYSSINNRTAEKYLTPVDQAKIKEEIEKLRKEAKEEYFKIIELIPLISYIEREDDIDSKYKLTEAFLKIEKSLEKLLEKGHIPST